MDGLCSGELARITGGRLNLGALPPLGGEFEPVGRIVTKSSMAQRGDVYWHFLSGQRAAGYEPEEAFARGALGVVAAGRSIEPWAGAFSIHVADARRALVDLGHWMRRQHCRNVIAVVSAQHNIVAPILATCFTRKPQQCAKRSANGLTARQTTRTYPLVDGAEIALRFLEHHAEHPWNVLDIAAERVSDWFEISHLCCPDIAVITSPIEMNAAGKFNAAKKADVTTLFGALQADGCIVLNGDDAELVRQAESASTARSVKVGRSLDCQWRITAAEQTASEARFTINDERISVASRGDWMLEELTLAYATVRTLGWMRSAFVAACEELAEVKALDTDTNRGNMEVPPLVSGLRESDTTLPPGLKRYAC